jgi:hypothetical protein
LGVLERANLRHRISHVEVEVKLRPTVSRPVYPGVGPSFCGPITRVSLIFYSSEIFFIKWGALSGERTCP